MIKTEAESNTDRKRGKVSKCLYVCMRSIHIPCVFASLLSMPGGISKETNTVHKSHGWQLQELNPSRQREPSRGEKILPFFLLCSLIPFPYTWLRLIFLKICGHKFNATQVDGPTTNTQIHTHTGYIHAGGWAAEKQNRAIFQRNNEINRQGR